MKYFIADLQIVCHAIKLVCVYTVKKAITLKKAFKLAQKNVIFYAVLVKIVNPAIHVKVNKMH
jgi:hypothetical protein